MVDLRRIGSVLEGMPMQPGTEKAKSVRPATGEFARALNEARQQPAALHFSTHALERMQQRGIELTPRELERIQNAVETAATKGSRSSLVLMDERAFVVSVANRTVITALENDALRDQIVTQIDSAVIL